MNIGSDAVFEIVNLTLPHLREGLSFHSATAAAKAIHEVVGPTATAISDSEKILAFVGEGADHHKVGHPILTHLTRETLNNGKVTAVRGRMSIGCPVETCPLRVAIVVPLRARLQIVGCLKFYNAVDEPFSQKEIEFAAGLANMLSIELELAEIDIQKKLTTQAELQALQAQISPHFLFNTLNTIASYCRHDGLLAEELLVEFADLFRRNLKQHRGFVSLREELDFVDRYLRFEQYRFGSRLHIERLHEPQALEVLVPPLILQPLVENAVTHGVTRRVGSSRVSIRSWIADDEVVVAVEDDGVGMDPAAFPHGAGIGMRNVQRRLAGLFGPQYGLVVRSPETGGTVVEVHLPRRISPAVFSLIEEKREADLLESRGPVP
jgi:LytS/YehU family sensor histidine kinase